MRTCSVCCWCTYPTPQLPSVLNPACNTLWFLLFACEWPRLWLFYLEQIPDWMCWKRFSMVKYLPDMNLIKVLQAFKLQVKSNSLWEDPRPTKGAVIMQMWCFENLFCVHCQRLGSDTVLCRWWGEDSFSQGHLSRVDAGWHGAWSRCSCQPFSSTASLSCFKSLLTEAALFSLKPPWINCTSSKTIQNTPKAFSPCVVLHGGIQPCESQQSHITHYTSGFYSHVFKTDGQQRRQRGSFQGFLLTPGLKLLAACPAQQS